MNSEADAPIDAPDHISASEDKIPKPKRPFKSFKNQIPPKSGGGGGFESFTKLFDLVLALKDNFNIQNFAQTSIGLLLMAT